MKGQSALEALKVNGRIERVAEGCRCYAAMREGGVLQWFFKETNAPSAIVRLKVAVGNFWIPYHEAREIRPSEAGELWEREGDRWTSIRDRQYGNLHMYNAHQDYKDIESNGHHSGTKKDIVHGKNGWKRVEPPVPDESGESMERIEVFPIMHTGKGDAGDDYLIRLKKGYCEKVDGKMCVLEIKN